MPAARAGRSAGAAPAIRPRFAPPCRASGRRTARSSSALSIAHPWLIDEWVEQLAALDFPEPELDSLRSPILEVADTARVLTVNAAATPSFVRPRRDAWHPGDRDGQTSGFAVCGGDDPDVIRQGLKETLQLLQLSATARPMRSRPIRPTIICCAWALKERELQDGPIGGVESRVDGAQQDRRIG